MAYGGIDCMKKFSTKIFISIFLALLFIALYFAPCICGDNSIRKCQSTKFNYTLDVEFIFNLTKKLSSIIFTEYDEENGEIAKGRAFGTKGEHKAAEIIFENMTKLGLYTKKELIINTPTLPDVASKMEVIDYKIIVKNNSDGSSKIVDCYIAPPCIGPRENPEKLTYNFSFQNLTVEPVPNFTMPYGEKHLDGNYLFIKEEYEYNPNIKPDFLKQIISRFSSPYSDFALFWDGTKEIIDVNMWYNYYPHCQGLIHYDFHNDTHNMAYYPNCMLPILSINGTMGKEILENPNNITVDFYLNQSYNKSIKSYNIIGQLNGTYEDKIVIIDSLYDSWWCQGTADSAIGMSFVLAIAKYFQDHNITPKYTIKFIAFGGEEYGFRGARYYEDVHEDENIIYVIDLNQLGFTQEKPKLYLEILSNNIGLLKDIWNIASESEYGSITGNAGIRKFWMPMGAPSNDRVFARNRLNCKTVCFLKGLNWVLHHRDGLSHSEGDVLKYFDWIDVKVTGEIILNVVKNLTTN